MKITIDVQYGDYVSSEETDPLMGAIEGEALTHVGHLCRRVAVEVRGLIPVAGQGEADAEDD